MKHLELQNILKYFTYDEASPSGLIWVVDKNTKTSTDVFETAGTTDSNSYYTVCVHRKTYLVHRIIWCLKYGEIPDGKLIDHINGNRSDNKMSNLRLSDKLNNNRNRSRSRNNTSNETGVHSFCKDGLVISWIANWYPLGKGRSGRKTKSFSVAKYGYDQAKKLAIEYRKEAIKTLNEQNAQYSERHGI